VVADAERGEQAGGCDAELYAEERRGAQQAGMPIVSLIAPGLASYTQKLSSRKKVFSQFENVNNFYGSFLASNHKCHSTLCLMQAFKTDCLVVVLRGK
jgi:hypothetical protein